MEQYNQIAAEDNKTKPVSLSQESGKTVGSLARNKNEMYPGDASKKKKKKKHK
jgi:hypothetical protein